MQKRNVLNSPRLLELKKHRRRAVLNKIFLSVVAFTAILFLLAYLSRINKLNISDVQIVGNKLVDADVLKTSVEESIAGKYLWLFPKTNILYYPQNTIKNNLQNEFKRLKDVNLEIKDNKTLVVIVNERKAKYTWCGQDTIPAQSNTPVCYFLDENGFVFDQAPYFSGNVYFKFYGTVDVDGSPLGSYFYKDKFRSLISFKDILVGIGLKPTSLSIADNGDVNIFLAKGATAVNEPKIILKIDADFQNVAENLQAALNTEPLKSSFKNKYSSLEYIDLRFGNKVYDKFLGKTE